MEEANLSVFHLMKQIKVLMHQSMRMSEDLELAYERISVLEKELKIQNKQVSYEMKILHLKTKGA